MFKKYEIKELNTAHSKHQKSQPSKALFTQT